ncbi:hypothetical protein ACEQUB_02061 [Ralstonia syzygii]
MIVGTGPTGISAPSYTMVRAGFDTCAGRRFLHFVHVHQCVEEIMPYLIAWLLSVPAFVLLIWLFVR